MLYLITFSLLNGANRGAEIKFHRGPYRQYCVDNQDRSGRHCGSGNTNMPALEVSLVTGIFAMIRCGYEGTTDGASIARSSQ